METVLSPSLVAAGAVIIRFFSLLQRPCNIAPARGNDRHMDAFKHTLLASSEWRIGFRNRNTQSWACNSPAFGPPASIFDILSPCLGLIVIFPSVPPACVGASLLWACLLALALPPMRLLTGLVFGRVSEVPRFVREAFMLVATFSRASYLPLRRPFY